MAERRSLRARLVRWMVVSTSFTLVVFASTLWVALRIEEASDPRQVGLLSEATEQVLVALLVAAPIALLVGAGGAHILGRRALLPLENVLRDARRITTSRLDTRLALPDHRDELYDLIEELNRVFARLEVGFGALGRYAADASHELRTPLAVIAAELDVALQRPRTSEEWKATAEKALRETLHLARLVDSLLALARAEGPLEQSVGFDLREQVDHVLASAAEKASLAGIAIAAAAEGGDDPAFMEGDPDAIASAVRNIVDNALRHARAGGRVRAGVSHEDQHWVVRVDDSGPGVPVDQREVIFSPLRRKASAESHGLGLAIARRIVERHRGTVSVEDAPGGGARFVIRVPRL